MSLPDQKFRWLVYEQGFSWDEKKAAFINPELPLEQVTLNELKAEISYRTFQRVVMRKVTRARNRLLSARS